MKNFYFTLIPVLLAACSSERGDTVVFDPDCLDDVPVEKMYETTLNEDHIFGSPTQISVVNDTALVVLDNADNGYVAHLFSTDGRYIRSFGKTGQGPNEYLAPENISISRDHSRIYLYDFRLVKSGVYDVASLLNGDEQISRLSYENNSVGGIMRFDDVFHSNDSDYLCLGLTENCRILSVRNGETMHVYNDYPRLIDDIECNRSVWNNGSLHAVSPDGRHIVYATWIGMAFEILTNDDDGMITSRRTEGFYEPLYEVVQGTIPVCVSSTEECFEGFRSISATDDGFYGCVSGYGPDYNDGNIICFFDYDGNLKRKIEIRSIVDCMSVSGNTIYALAHKEHQDIRLIRIEL